jgi:hypothetical protein
VNSDFYLRETLKKKAIALYPVQPAFLYRENENGLSPHVIPRSEVQKVPSMKLTNEVFDCVKLSRLQNAIKLSGDHLSSFGSVCFRIIKFFIDDTWYV